MRRPELWEKSDKKYKKVQEWTKIISGLSPLRMKNKNGVRGWEIHGRIWNQVIPFHTNR